MYGHKAVYTMHVSIDWLLVAFIGGRLFFLFSPICLNVWPISALAFDRLITRISHMLSIGQCGTHGGSARASIIKSMIDLVVLLSATQLYLVSIAMAYSANCLTGFANVCWLFLHLAYFIFIFLRACARVISTCVKFSSMFLFRRLIGCLVRIKKLFAPNYCCKLINNFNF